MTVIINPGTGDINAGTRVNAAKNMLQFTSDVDEARGGGPPWADFTPAGEPDRGRWPFVLRCGGDEQYKILMPGLPIEQVRFTGADGQNIWDFPRLYVDGSSWVWKSAVRMCEPDTEDAN